VNRPVNRTTLATAIAVGVVATLLGGAAGARPLRSGAHGRAVFALQVRVAGWFPGSRTRVHFALDGVYGAQTTRAVKAFQRHYGLVPDGVAGPSTQAVLRRLQDADGSTAHFDFREFAQNRNPACSAQANAYAGGFRGGMVSRRLVRRNVRRLMWRLEALRAKGKSRAVGVNSGFRSVAYNRCIGGAGLSQHLYGTAADNRMANTPNARERYLAKGTEFHGIGCYSSQTHNHFDIRIDNRDLPAARSWWWPRRDRKGRDLDDSGKPCWGERRRSDGSPARRAAGPAGPLVATVARLEAWAAAGEPDDLGGAD
jgi:zinc D-Ala-D-Ala carboxypeptidase